MKQTLRTNMSYIVATVLSIGTLAGCEYCQPLLLVSVAYLVVERWVLPGDTDTSLKHAS